MFAERSLASPPHRTKDAVVRIRADCTGVGPTQYACFGRALPPGKHDAAPSRERRPGNYAKCYAGRALPRVPKVGEIRLRGTGPRSWSVSIVFRGSRTWSCRFDGRSSRSIEPVPSALMGASLRLIQHDSLEREELRVDIAVYSMCPVPSTGRRPNPGGTCGTRILAALRSICALRRHDAT